jgi:predicted nucleotidyltransferase
VADLPEVIGLLHLADWTRLSLSAEVRFESGRAALLIAPGGHYRMEHQDEDGVVQGNDGQRGWTWWPSGRSEPSPAEVGLDDGRPVAVLFCPQDLLDGYVLEILGPVTACGRDAIAIAATPRAGDRLRERVEAAVDAEQRSPDLGSLRAARRQILAAASERGLRDVRVFGSVARGDAVETSDVDLLVAPGPDTTLFDLSGFALDVEEIVGRHVDVATPRGLKARIRDRVLAEAVAL